MSLLVGLETAFCLLSVDLSAEQSVNSVLNESRPKEEEKRSEVRKESLKGHPECIITHRVKESKYNYRFVFDDVDLSQDRLLAAVVARQ